jgi:RNA recognition motif-containing protein
MAAAAPAAGYTRPANSLFVSGLPEDVDVGALVRHFERIDQTIRVRLVNILRNYQTMRPRGSAVVEFVSPEDVEKAMKSVNYTEISGRELHLMPYKAGGIKDRITGNVFVKNLPADFKSKELYDLCSPFEKSSPAKSSMIAREHAEGMATFNSRLKKPPTKPWLKSPAKLSADQR